MIHFANNTVQQLADNISNEQQHKYLLRSSYIMDTLGEKFCNAVGGADTIYVSYKVDWVHQEFYDEHIRLMQSIQDALKSDIETDEPVHQSMLVNGHEFFVLGYGANPGDSKMTYFPYVLRELDIRYLISRRQYDPEMKMGNVFVQIGSKPLMRFGEAHVRDLVRHAVESIGGVIMEENISRLDLCVDVVGAEVDPFINAINDMAFVCRARKTNIYHATDDNKVSYSVYRNNFRPTGLQIGCANIVARIYDKLEEVKNDEEKRMILLQNRYNNECPKKAIRVEFQLRRQALRNFSINNKLDGIVTWEDSIIHRASIVNYLCTSWLRFYQEPVKNRNHSERLTEDDFLPEWSNVVKLFRSLDKTTVYEQVRSKPKKIALRSERQKNMAVGALISFAVRDGFGIQSEETLQQEFCDNLAGIIRDKCVKKIFNEYVRRQKEFNSRSVKQYDEYIPF